MNKKNTKELFYLSKNVTFIRKSNNLSKKEMAKLLGIGVKSLSKLEKGELPPRMGANIFFNIQKHFGISPKFLFME